MAPPNFTATELIGMGIGGPGVLNARQGRAAKFDFQSEWGRLNGGDGGDVAAAPGAVPTLTMRHHDHRGHDHAIDATMIGHRASAPDGWVMKTLFRDWGDTAGDAGDGGFETGAIVAKNLGEGTPYPFDRKLSRPGT